MKKSLLLLLFVFIIGATSIVVMADEPIVVEPIQNTQLEAEAGRMINEYRKAFGVICQHYNNILATSARDHLVDMDERGYFDHDTPEGLTPEDRARAAGFAGFATESLAAGFATAADAVSGWRASRLHNQGFFFYTMHEMGIGYYAGGNTYTDLWGYVQGTLDSGSPGPMPCTEFNDITVTHVPRDLAATNTNTAYPTFTWTHDTSTGNGRTPATQFSIEILTGDDPYNPIVVEVASNTRSADQICSGNTCSLRLTEAALSDGQYTLYIRANSPTGGFVWTGHESVLGEDAEALVFNIEICLLYTS